MEDIDIENLNFDVYNREVYLEQNSKPVQINPQPIDIQKKYKNEINKYVENYYKNRFGNNDINDENLERIKKRKY